MILETAARNAAADAIVDLLDAGAAAGYVQFETSADVEVATLPLSDPAFGAAANGVATAASIASDTNATGGTVAQASWYDSNNVKRWENTVATSGAEINLSSVAIGAGDTVSLSSFTLTMPAS